MTKSSAAKIRTLSVVIQWREDEGEEIYISHRTMNEAKECSSEAKFSSDVKSGRAISRSSSQHNGRLRPTDRLILNALRTRLHEDEEVTAPVTTRELMEECSISRRQVQICLRRLNEGGWINHLQAGNKLGDNAGFRYLIFKDALHR